MLESDGFGFSGLVLDYALIIFFTTGALLIFLYCLKKRRLDFDEEPKYQMLNEDERL